MAGSCWGIVLAGGSGERFGGPKQFSELGGRSLLAWAVAATLPFCDGVIAVVPAAHVGALPRDVVDTFDAAKLGEPSKLATVTGGADRSASVRAGLAAVPASAERVLVHGASHPRAAGVIGRLFDALDADTELDAVFASAPMLDVAKQLDGSGRVVGGFDKSGWVLMQQPVLADAAALRSAYAEHDGGEDLEVLLAAGGVVHAVPGDPVNLHVATPRDLEIAEALLTVTDE